MKKTTKSSIEVQGAEISILSTAGGDFISLTAMLKAKDGDFFISDWLRNRNTIEFLGIWESVYNPNFNSGEFATINGQAGLNRNLSKLNYCIHSDAIKSKLFHLRLSAFICG